MARCAQCGKQVGGLGGVKGGLVTTATGRRVCRPCNERLLGTAAGVITAGADASTSEQLGSGILVTGWLERVRAARRRGRD